jgi:hypothetical protein
MDSEIRGQKPALHTLIPLEDFKAILGLDDRDDTLSRYCLITATYTIEQYCRRRLFVRRHFERFEYAGDLLQGPDTFHNDYTFFWPQEPACAGEVSPYSENRLTGSPALVGVLREYPVREVLAVYAYCYSAEPELAEPEFYGLCPEIEERLDIPHTLRLSPALGRLSGLTAFKAVYRAGYVPGKVPADLASACLELAAWNMTRYRGRRIGMTGNIRGNGKDGEHLEASMPENVRGLLEPYRRRVI